MPQRQRLNKYGRTVHRAVLLLFLAMASQMPVVAGLNSAARAAMVQEPVVLVTAGGDKTIIAEIARTSSEKALGLMYRTHLDDNKGMLFVYDVAQEITMWMKNTYIPLDMVFVRANGTVLRIAENTEPLSEDIVASRGPARFVLELAGGAARRLGLKAGDRLRHPLFGK